MFVCSILFYSPISSLLRRFVFSIKTNPQFWEEERPFPSVRRRRGSHIPSIRGRRSLVLRAARPRSKWALIVPQRALQTMKGRSGIDFIVMHVVWITRDRSTAAEEAKQRWCYLSKALQGSMGISLSKPAQETIDQMPNCHPVSFLWSDAFVPTAE